MPSLHATLAWAMPVKVEVLGAHLEAYINLLPTINAIRLCHRSDCGAPISTLPVELLLLIEDHLISNERKKTRKAWAKDFKCFEMRCEASDHYSKPKVASWRRMLEIGALPDVDTELSTEMQLEFLIEGKSDEWFHEHFNRQASWEERVGYKAIPGNGFFHDHAALVSRHFGLEISVSHARPNSEPPGERWYFNSVFPTETTFAYIKLPDAPELAQRWFAEDVDHIQDLHVEDSCALSIALPPRLSMKSKRRFKRAMKILDLTPSVNWSQRGRSLQARDISKKRDSKHYSGWPRPTLLIKTTTLSDEL